MSNPDPTPVPFAYRDADGAGHRVVLRERADGAWQVLDITVIETLTGVGDGRDAAEAVARDYVAQRHRPPLGSCQQARRAVA